MPLDTRPQTPARQAILVGVLLLFFLASLGFAQLLVKRPRPPEEPVTTEAPFGLPEGFAVDTKNPTFGTLRPKVSLYGKVNGDVRRIYYFELPGKQAGVRALQDRALAVYVAVTGGKGDTPELRRASLGDARAVDLRGLLKDRPGFALLRAAYIGDTFVAIVYVGATPLSADDESTFESVVGTGESSPSKT